MSEQDVYELQERVVYLEDAVQQLSDQVASQASQLEKYELWFKKLNQQLKSLPDSGGGEEAPPPHY